MNIELDTEPQCVFRQWKWGGWVSNQGSVRNNPIFSQSRTSPRRENIKRTVQFIHAPLPSPHTVVKTSDHFWFRLLHHQQYFRYITWVLKMYFLAEQIAGIMEIPSENPSPTVAEKMWKFSLQQLRHTYLKQILCTHSLTRVIPNGLIQLLKFDQN